MKIRLPEKRFFSIAELAQRWECAPNDVQHLLDIGELPRSEKHAAIQGKRKIYWGYYGYNRNGDNPCFLPLPSPAETEKWKKDAREDELVIELPVQCVGPFDGVEHHNLFMECARVVGEIRETNPEVFECVILLSDVLIFESASIQQEGRTDQLPIEKFLGNRERDSLLTIIAVLCKEAKLDTAKHAKTAGLIQGAAAQMGVSIGETTIENHLKKIPDALSNRMNT